MSTRELLGVPPVADRQRVQESLLKGLLESPFLVLPILAVALTARLYALDAQSVWLDEAFSIYVARQPFDRMMEIIVNHDTPPPLYYTMLHLWLGLGFSTFNARLLSTLLGTSAVLAVYFLGTELRGRRLGAVAGLLMALSPFQVYHGQETRMYSLLALNCALSALFLLKALKTGKWRFWVAYVLATSLATYTQVASVFFIAGEWMAVVLYVGFGGTSPHPDPLPEGEGGRGLPLSRGEGRGEWPTAAGARPRWIAVLQSYRPWLLSQAAVLLLWLPWLPGFLRQSQTYQRFWIERPTWDSIVTLGLEFSSYYLPHWKVPFGREVLVAVALLLALGIAVKVGRREYLFLVCLFVVPVVAMYLVSQVKPLFLTRALIPSLAPFLLLVAAGIVRLRPRALGVGLVALLVLLNLTSLYRLYSVPMKEEWEEATTYVVSRAEPKELVLFVAADAQIPFDYYLEGEDLDLERRGLPVDVFSVGPLEPAVKAEDLGRIDQLMAGRDSFWLIESHADFPDPEGGVRGYSDQQYRQTDLKEFRGISISRYEMRRSVERSR